jgi:peptidoglycan/LPS O-acetylase OafA/YrhL
MLALIVMREAKNLYEKYFDRILLFISACYATYIHPFSIPLFTAYNPKDQHIITILHVIFFVSIVLLVYISKYIKNKKLLDIFIVLGGITYPLYLMHETIGYACIKYLTHTYQISGTTVAFIFEIFIIIISYMVYLQDKKMRGWLRNKLLTKQ